MKVIRRVQQSNTGSVIVVVVKTGQNDGAVLHHARATQFRLKPETWLQQRHALPTTPKQQPSTPRRAASAPCLAPRPSGARPGRRRCRPGPSARRASPAPRCAPGPSPRSRPRSAPSPACRMQNFSFKGCSRNNRRQSFAGDWSAQECFTESESQTKRPSTSITRRHEDRFSRKWSAGWTAFGHKLTSGSLLQQSLVWLFIPTCSLTTLGTVHKRLLRASLFASYMKIYQFKGLLTSWTCSKFLGGCTVGISERLVSVRAARRTCAR